MILLHNSNVTDMYIVDPIMIENLIIRCPCFKKHIDAIPLLTDKVLFLINECKENHWWLVCMEIGEKIMVNMTLRTEIGQRTATCQLQKADQV